ncbi:MAG TPA: tRNA (adenosine(37)-N6)-dimethylallyltransferase MiaA [Candidatus Paceibacterota bacterium]|nr:tRNA (adenosine(37)-N6)-dimethylallyltransferase MiaA [Candidatus Paceibacterota bacterium]
MKRILLIAGPTASGKSSRAVEEALARGGEVISVDSRQVYRGLDIGTEKIPLEERRGVPHHLLDIREPEGTYSAGDFLGDATRLIAEIQARGHVPILVGGTHYYFDALLYGLPMGTEQNSALREDLEQYSDADLYARVRSEDARRATELDPKNRRRLIRALEIIEALGAVPPRPRDSQRQFDALETSLRYQIETDWIVLNPPKEELATRIDSRLKNALDRGLVEEVRRIRERVGDERLSEFGLEYRIVGEYLRGERDEASLLPALSAKLKQYARRQRAWLRKLTPSS